MSQEFPRFQIFIFCFACLVYSNTLLAGFAFDDNFAVINNKDVTSGIFSDWTFLSNDFWGQRLDSDQSHKSYRPVTIAAFKLQHFFGKQQFAGEGFARDLQALRGKESVHPLPFHATNVLLHGAVSVLVYKLTRALIRVRDNHPTVRKRKSWEAFIASSLFAVHPVHTEAVAGVVGQAELWCAMFGLSALLVYLEASNKRKSLEVRVRQLVLSILLVVASTLAKEIGITLIGAMLMFDLWLAQNLSLSYMGMNQKGLSREQAGKLFWRSSAQGSWLQWTILRWLALCCTAVCYVAYRSWMASNQLVSIYRKVENPIPFAESALTRGLNISYLHARYALLLVAPFKLSADWSFACVPLVECIADVRNAASAGLYAILLAIVFQGVVSGAVKHPSPAGISNHVQARYRAFVLLGLLIGPFLPASNIFFYVGTFIGERLLYLPSVGYCLLVSTVLSGHFEKSLAHRRAAQCALLCVLAVSTFKTWNRNWEWNTEGDLFRAARQVCGDSAKVQLNSGILERRYERWEHALQHFERARQIEPGYCEAGYWIGITLIAQRRQAGIMELEKALQCKYVAVEASKALAEVFHNIIEQAPYEVWAPTHWARILQHPPLNRVGEACDVLEKAAVATGQHGVLEPCYEALRGNRLGQISTTVLKCMRNRMAVRSVAEAKGLAAVHSLTALYSYIGGMSQKCRLQLDHSGIEAASAGHVAFVHAMQQRRVEDPWLQLAWAEVLISLSRAPEAAKHFQAAAFLLRQWLASAKPDQTLLGIHPVSGSVVELTHAEAAAASLAAMQAVGT